MPPQQNQVPLAIASMPAPSYPVLAPSPNSCRVIPHISAELVTRMADAGLVTKASLREDRRRMELVLTEKSEVLLRYLTTAQINGLKTLEPALLRALGRLGGSRA